MATTFNFNGKIIKLAGVYSRITSGIKNPPLALDYGKVLIVDTGSGAGWGFGAGVIGTLESGADAIYQDITDQGLMKSAVRGGLWWKLAEPLFKPDGASSNGASEVEFVRAATTVPATLSYAFTGGVTNTQSCVTATTVLPTIVASQENTITISGTVDVGDTFFATLGSTVSYTAIFGDTIDTVATALEALIAASVPFNTVVTSSVILNVITLVAIAVNTPFTQTSTASNTADTGGTLLIKMRNEGTVGNGALVLGNLTTGYAGVFAAGTDDTSKYIFRILRGTFKGFDPTSLRPWDDVLEADAVPELIVQSPEVANITELIAWMTSDGVFNSEFKLTSSTIGLDDFFPSDIVLYSGYNVSSGGTEVYSNTAFDSILDIIVEHDYSFILSDRYNNDVTHLYNTKFQTHIGSEAKFDKMLIIGGGDDLATFQTNSIDAAVGYNDDKVIVVHGGVKYANRNAPTGFDTQASIFKAAAVCGRLAGLPPQVPITFKGLKYSAEVHILNTKEQEKALKFGVLYTIWDNDFRKYTVAQGINTIQTNSNFINDDGTSFSVQIKRIVAQINKEIIVNAKVQLFGNPNGVNQNTLSVQTVTDWLKGYLKARTAKPTADNLIIGYDSASIVVERIQDQYHVQYKFQPNGEITKMFFTGFMIN